MKHIIENCDEGIYRNSIWDKYFGSMNVGVLDIETTGLNPSENCFVLGGIYNSREGKLHQILAEHRREEASALVEYMKEIVKVDMIVTYNGRHFDVPFIQRRLAAHADNQSLCDYQNNDFPYNMDLYILASRYSPIKALVPNLRQKTLENYMGLWQSRTDEISGADSAKLYECYEKTADPQTEKKILLHNNDDLRQLGRLIKVIDKCDLHKAVFFMGFPLGDLTVEQIRIRAEYLYIGGSQKRQPLEYKGYSLGDYPVRTRFRSKERTFEFRVPLIRDSGLAVLDLEAAGLDLQAFADYPLCESGFLVVNDKDGINYREINSFIIEFIRKFQRENI